MAQVQGTDEKVNISNIAKQTTVPVATLWKRICDKVRGTGHRSGGPRQPKVLMKGRLLFRFLFFHLNSPHSHSTEKLKSQYIVYTCRSILFKKQRMKMS